MGQETHVSESWQKGFAWIESELGGSLVSAERQPRWRPAWFLDLEREGERVPLYFRGDRGEAGTGLYSLEREQRVLEFLEAHGIPVPHVYGFCPEPRGIVMERCAGAVCSVMDMKAPGGGSGLHLLRLTAGEKREGFRREAWC